MVSVRDGHGGFGAVPGLGFAAHADTAGAGKSYFWAVIMCPATRTKYFWDEIARMTSLSCFDLKR